MKDRHGHDMTMMAWRPRMVCLTQVRNPDLDGGLPTLVYVDPQLIVSARRSMSAFAKAHSYGTPHAEWQYHPTVPVTEVNCSKQFLLVEESPEEVARLRDQAFGFEPEQPPNPPVTLRSAT